MMDGVLNMIMAGAIGLIVGGLFMYFATKGQSKNDSVREVEQKLENYQNEVEGHFAKTADLIDNLTDSYKEVFEHLSESAEKLLSEEQIQNQLINRRSREVTIKYLKGAEEEEGQEPTE